MTEPFFMEETGAHGIARITLTRPDRHNVLDAGLVAGLTSALRGLDSDQRVRVAVLAAKGTSFSAGLDLRGLQAQAAASESDNLADVEALAELLAVLNALNKPTVALIQGDAHGLAVGLIACCDIAVAVEEAGFCFPEAQRGLIPAIVAPYVLAAIGARAARRYFLSGERFSAWEAHRLGLVHEVVTADRLDMHCRGLLDQLLQGGPLAQRAAKAQIAELSAPSGSDAHRRDALARLARLRTSEEGREGITAFLEKRHPSWQPE